MTFETLLVEQHGTVMLATLNRPQALNALNATLLTELSALIAGVATDAGLRVLMLTGAGDRAFGAGADIAELASLDAEGARALRGQRPGRLRGPRAARQAVHRGHQRICPGRWLRAGHGVHVAAGRRHRAVRPAGNRPGLDPGIWRQPATRAAGGPRPGPRPAARRPPHRGGRGRTHRAHQQRRASGGSEGGGAGPVAAAGRQGAAGRAVSAQRCVRAAPTCRSNTRCSSRPHCLVCRPRPRT